MEVLMIVLILIALINRISPSFRDLSIRLINGPISKACFFLTDFLDIEPAQCHVNRIELEGPLKFDERVFVNAIDIILDPEYRDDAIDEIIRIVKNMDDREFEELDKKIPTIPTMVLTCRR